MAEINGVVRRRFLRRRVPFVVHRLVLRARRIPVVMDSATRWRQGSVALIVLPAYLKAVAATDLMVSVLAAVVMAARTFSAARDARRFFRAATMVTSMIS